MVTLLGKLPGLGGVRPEIYLGDHVAGLRLPILVIWGENDMVPADEGREVASRIPDCRFEVLPGVGHFPFLEAPEITARLIRDFIDA